MNVNKLTAQTLSMAESGTKKLASVVEGIDVSKETDTIADGVQEITGNYGKAITQLASNTVAEGEKELSTLEKIFAKLENRGKKVIKFADDSDEMEVLLFNGKHNDYIKSRYCKIYRIR